MKDTTISAKLIRRGDYKKKNMAVGDLKKPGGPY